MAYGKWLKYNLLFTICYLLFAVPMLIGHEEQLKMFQKITAAHKLAHAYLFSGPEGVGKRHFARLIARHTQCLGQSTFNDIVLDGCSCASCSSKDNMQRPDIFYHEGGLSVAEVRALRKFLSLSPYSSQHKVVIVDDAEAMTTEAANAMLKVVEEPKGDVIFIFITKQERLILPTIASRCSGVKFFYVPDRIIAQRLETGSIEDMKPHWGGRPGFALRFISEPSFARTIRGYKEDCTIFLNDSITKRFAVAGKYARLDRPDAMRALHVWVEHVREGGTRQEMLGGLLGIYKYLQTSNANIQFMLNSLALMES